MEESPESCRELDYSLRLVDFFYMTDDSLDSSQKREEQTTSHYEVRYSHDASVVVETTI